MDIKMNNNLEGLTIHNSIILKPMLRVKVPCLRDF